MDGILLNRQAQLPRVPESVDDDLRQYILSLHGILTEMQRRTFDTFSLLSFFDRGDPAALDKQETGDKSVFDTDGTWNTWDLSATVPNGAKAVLLSVSVTDDAVGSSISFRKEGNTETINVSTVTTQAANQSTSIDIIVPCSTGRVIEYMGTNAAFADISAVIKGWFK